MMTQVHKDMEVELACLMCIGGICFVVSQKYDGSLVLGLRCFGV